ncbi:MAG: zinc ribbon domain-containing protein [Thermoplasmata archaeon]|nr:zinc ribbon domain-containing protein [Thermoplasmata archaeon]
MKCSTCGKDVPDDMRFCGYCGKLVRPAEKPTGKQVQTAASHRRCVSCGRSISWDANACQYCGHDYRGR